MPGAGTYTLAELAERVHGNVVGDGQRVLTGIRPLDDAVAGAPVVLPQPALPRVGASLSRRCAPRRRARAVPRPRPPGVPGAVSGLREAAGDLPPATPASVRRAPERGGRPIGADRSRGEHRTDGGGRRARGRGRSNRAGCGCRRGRRCRGRRGHLAPPARRDRAALPRRRALHPPRRGRRRLGRVRLRDGGRHAPQGAPGRHRGRRGRRRARRQRVRRPRDARGDADRPWHQGRQPGAGRRTTCRSARAACSSPRWASPAPPSWAGTWSWPGQSGAAGHLHLGDGAW